MTEQEMLAWHPSALLVQDEYKDWSSYDTWELLPDPEDADERQANRYARFWLWSHDKLKRKDGAYLEACGRTGDDEDLECISLRDVVKTVNDLVVLATKQGDLLLTAAKQRSDIVTKVAETNERHWRLRRQVVTNEECMQKLSEKVDSLAKAVESITGELNDMYSERRETIGTIFERLGRVEGRVGALVQNLDNHTMQSKPPQAEWVSCGREDAEEYKWSSFGKWVKVWDWNNCLARTEQ